MSSTTNVPEPSRRARDITITPFPTITVEQWRAPDEVLAMLYQRAEAHSIDLATWYLRDRRWKKRLSQLLRALAVILTAAGGLQPLISTTDTSGRLRWGYVLLAAAGGCIAFDHYFGLSSRWMRDMLTAQQLQRRIQKFQYDWTELSARNTPTELGQVPEFLDLLRTFVIDVSDIAIAETEQWVAEFQTGINNLKGQVQHH